MSVIRTSQTRFLVVDDDEFVLDVYEDLLQNLGYQNVEKARNGNIALGKLISTEDHYDILICDLNMPEMNGIEFLRQLDECEFGGSLIIASGESPKVRSIANEVAANRKINVLGTISKPVTQATLQRLIDQAAGNRF